MPNDGEEGKEEEEEERIGRRKRGERIVNTKELNCEQEPNSTKYKALDLGQI